MRLSEFKEGDLITRIGRTDPLKPGDVGDGSYMGDKLRFLGITANHVWYQHSESAIFGDDVHNVDMENWDDDRWDYYPEAQIEKWKKKYRGKVPV